MPERIEYVVATTGRTGSNLLQRLLRNNGLGNPDEWFHQDLFGFGQAVADGVSSEAWLERMRREKTQDGCFGTKMMATHVREIRHAMEQEVEWDFGVLPALYPDAKYIYLWREDVDRQALSFFRAKTSGRWLRWRDEEGVEHEQPPALDVAFVERDVAAIRRLNRQWERFFEREGIEPYRLTYERLDANRAEVVKEIGAFLGKPLEGEPVLDVEIVRQADELTERYLRELREHRRLASTGA